jgi:hypothetical protein
MKEKVKTKTNLCCTLIVGDFVELALSLKLFNHAIEGAQRAWDQLKIISRRRHLVKWVCSLLCKNKILFFMTGLKYL